MSVNELCSANRRSQPSFIAEARMVKTLIAKGAPVPFRITGESMAPLIKVGDRVIVRQASTADLSLGDIIVVGSGPFYVTHRFLGPMVRQAGGQLWHKGDRGYRLEKVDAGRLVGKVTRIDRPNGCIMLDSSFWRTANRMLGVYHYGLAHIGQPAAHLAGLLGLRPGGSSGWRRRLFDASVFIPDLLVSLITRWGVKERA